MKIMSTTGKYNILERDVECGKVLGTTPTIFQIECITTEEVEKVRVMIEELL